MTLLFVYGSLRRGERHHAELAGAEFAGDAETAPGYRVVQRGEYPALVEAGDASVSGELYFVDDALLEQLDVFEGVPELYRRSRIALGDGRSAEAYFAVG